MTKTKLKVFILAGGHGKRLWPLSTSERPKQLIRFKFLSGKSLLQLTFQRANQIVSSEDIFIVSKAELKQKIIEQIREIYPPFSSDNVIVQPEVRNTLGAITLAMLHADEFALIFPSDHLIKRFSNFVSSLKQAQALAKDSLITFGIKPTMPHTGYGYIKAIGNRVEDFKEKPDEETAKKYLKEGYLWNSGIFLFHKQVFENELRKAQPQVYSLYKQGKEAFLSHYHEIPSLSIDKAILEKSSNISLIPLSIEWNDVGSFDALLPFFNKQGENFVYSNKEVRIIGISDVIVVEGEKGILICKRGMSERVKDFSPQ